MSLIRAIFVVSLVGAVASFLSLTAQSSHGQWDAWAIWNLKARFIVTGHFRDIFSPALWWSHPNYPMLLPGLVAFGWWLTGSQATGVPAVIAGAFTFGTVALLVWSLKGWRGWAAGIVLLSCHAFVKWGAAQYADVPLGFFVLACEVGLGKQRTAGSVGTRISNHTMRRSIFLGICAALAASTKQEGWLCIVAVLILYPFDVWLFAGMVPILGLTMAIRLMAPLDPYSFNWHLLFAQDRWLVLGQALWTETTGPFLIPVLAVLACAWRLRQLREMAFIGIIVSGLMLAVILSPYEIRWQISTALERLLVQVLPATLYVASEAIEKKGDILPPFSGTRTRTVTQPETTGR